MPDFKTIGKYKVDRDKVLGRGGFGKVYLAEDLKKKEYVAAKEIYIGGDKTLTEMARQEVDLMKRIPHHPNILQIKDDKIEESDLWIFVEYCALGNLDGYCEKNSLTMSQRFEFMIQISSAVQLLHSQNPPVA